MKQKLLVGQLFLLDLESTECSLPSRAQTPCLSRHPQLGQLSLK